MFNLIIRLVDSFIFYKFRSDKQEDGLLDNNFVAFLRATLGKMAGTGILEMEVIDLDFWTAWPRRFYNIKAYDLTKDENDDDDDDYSYLDMDDDVQIEKPLVVKKKRKSSKKV